MWTLRVIGALYLLSGLWCAINPEASTQFLGLTANAQGFAEFVAVYGGLQVGLALAMLGSSFKANYIEAALFFSVLVSAALFAFRLLGMGLYGGHQPLLLMAVLEGVFVVALLKHYLAELKAQK